jgi:hypothetical protein
MDTSKASSELRVRNHAAMPTTGVVAMTMAGDSHPGRKQSLVAQYYSGTR